MRALCDYTTNEILQVEKTPEIGAPVPVNGKYVIPVPEGASVQVNSDTIILPSSDPGSVVAQSFAGLLAQFPQYDHVAFNPLIEDTDIEDLDLAAATTINGNDIIVRAQVGRGTGGPLVSGQAANTTAILPVNDGAVPARPGAVVTDTIDVGPFLPPPPAGVCEIPAVEEFVVWWKIYEFDVSHDIRSSFGLHSGVNAPALRQIVETDQEPAGLEVYLSTDDGQTWVRVNRMDPVCVCPGTDVRLAFLNFSPAKLYLASYAILF